MTQPSEEEVREYLAAMAHQNEIVSRAEAYRHAAAVFRAALALLDAGRKDRERLDWIDGKSLDGIHVEVWAKGNADIRVEREACVYWRNVEVKCDNVRAAIDQARGA